MDELLQILIARQIRYLLIGGQAIRLLGMPRFSMDWDLYLPPKDTENFKKLNDALEEDLDCLVEPLGPNGENFIQTYQTRYGVLQFHLGVPGLPRFDEAEARSVMRPNENGVTVRCVSGRDLLATKLAANRPSDQLDIEFLRELDKAGKLDG